MYLHGISDTRASGVGVLERFSRRGFEGVAYDSRGHGESGGTRTTYGYFEKRDLQRVMDVLPDGPVVLIGSSLGAAVALQAAAIDRRISAVVAAECFCDLRTVVADRAPFFFSASAVARSIALAERKGHYSADAVSPVASAGAIRIPVLLIHGEADEDTPPEHSRRIYRALGGPKRLIEVPGAGHGESLRGTVWEEVEAWIDSVVG